DAGAAGRGAQSHGGGIDDHHRIPGRALSGPDALFARGRGSGLADADVGPLLRPLSKRAPPGRGLSLLRDDLGGSSSLRPRLPYANLVEDGETPLTSALATIIPIHRVVRASFDQLYDRQPALLRSLPDPQSRRRIA